MKTRLLIIGGVCVCAACLNDLTPGPGATLAPSPTPMSSAIVIPTATITLEPTPVRAVDCSSLGAVTDDVIVNGDFEDGDTGWTLHSSGTGAMWREHDLFLSDESIQARSGSTLTRLGGYEGSMDRIWQFVTIPPDGVLTYWWRIQAPRLRSRLMISLLHPDGSNPVILAYYTDENVNTDWQQDCFDLSEFVGQGYRLEFGVHNDNYTMTAFDIDDVVLGSRTMADG